MPDPQRLILRILSGPNAGAEAVLADRLVVGSAEAADIVIADPGLQPEHFTIVVDKGTATVAIGEAPLVIDGETKRNGTYALAPFKLIKFGATCLAIGPEAGAWPTFAAADLLPAPAEAAAVPSHAETGTLPAAEDAPSGSAPDAAAPAPSLPASPKSALPKSALPSPTSPKRPSLASVLSSPRRKGMAAALAVLMVAALVGVVSFFLSGAEPDGAVNKAELVAVRAIVEAAEADGVTVSENTQGAVVVAGFVPTNEEQRRLRQSLLDANLPVKYYVVSLEQQVSAIRTLVAASGAQHSVEADPATGRIAIEGVAPETSHADALMGTLRRDIADLRPIDLRLSSPSEALDETREKLAAADLASSTQAALAGGVIRVTGVVADAKRPVVRRIVDALNERWGRIVKIEDATMLAKAAPVPLPRPEVTVQAMPPQNERISIVVSGRNGFVIDSHGKRFGIGGMLANGEVIEEIGADEIVTRKGGTTHRYTFNGGQ